MTGKDIQRRDIRGPFGRQHHILRQNAQPQGRAGPGLHLRQPDRTAARFQPGQPVILMRRQPGGDHRPHFAQPHGRGAGRV